MGKGRERERGRERGRKVGRLTGRYVGKGKKLMGGVRVRIKYWVEEMVWCVTCC